MTYEEMFEEIDEEELRAKYVANCEREAELMRLEAEK